MMAGGPDIQIAGDPEACPGPLSLRSALGAYLARPEASDEACQIRFGVGHATLERVVSGEVCPNADLAHALWQAVRWRPPAPMVGRPCFALAKIDGLWMMSMSAGDQLALLSIADAREAHGELGQLLAQHDQPDRAQL